MNCYALIVISCDCLYIVKGKGMSNACVKHFAKAELEPLMASSVKVDQILVTVCKSIKNIDFWSKMPLAVPLWSRNSAREQSPRHECALDTIV